MNKISFVYGLNSNAPTGGCTLQNNIFELLYNNGIKVEKHIADSVDSCSKFLRYVDEDQNELSHTIILDGIALLRLRKSLDHLRNRFKGKIIALIHCPFSHPEYCQESWLRDILDNTKALFEEEKRIFKIADRIISIGPLTQSILISQYGVEEQIITTLPPFLTEENKAFVNQIHLLNLNATTTQPELKLITVGSICSRKQQHQILSAAHRLSLRYPYKIHLTLVGDVCCEPSYYQNLLNSSLSNNLEVHYTGSLSWQDTLRMVKLSNCFLFASRYENFGLAPVEAAMCGVPIVSLRVGGFQDTLAPSSTLWVENESETSWDQALDTFVTNLHHFDCQARENAQGVTEVMSEQRAWRSLQHVFSSPMANRSTHSKIDISIENESFRNIDASQIYPKMDKKNLQALTYSHAIVMTIATMFSIILGNCLPILLAYLRLILIVKAPWSPANVVTIFRTVAIVAVFCWYEAQCNLVCIPPLVLIVASLLFVIFDLLDGWLARHSKSGPTPIGALLDIEGDSIAMLFLSLAAMFMVWEGAVIAGLLRYIYVIVSKAGDLHTNKLNGGKGRWLAKYMAFFTVFALAISIVWDSKFVCVLGVLNLVASFSVDFYQVWEYHRSVPNEVKGHSIV